MTTHYCIDIIPGRTIKKKEFGPVSIFWHYVNSLAYSAHAAAQTGAEIPRVSTAVVVAQNTVQAPAVSWVPCDANQCLMASTASWTEHWTLRHNKKSITKWIIVHNKMHLFRYDVVKIFLKRSIPFYNISLILVYASFE